MSEVKDWEVKYFRDIEEYNEGKGLSKRIPLLVKHGTLTMRNAAFIHFDFENNIIEAIGGQDFDRAMWSKWLFSQYCPGFQVTFMSKGQICAAVEVCARLADKVYLQQKSGKCYTKSNVVKLRK